MCYRNLQKSEAVCMILKPRGRVGMKTLFPLVRKIRPRRCALTGETEKHQTAYPPAYMHGHKDFNKPKKYPMEIDHISGVPSWAKRWDLRWLTKLAHIARTNLQLFPGRRKIRKGAPSRVPGNKLSYE